MEKRIGFIGLGIMGISMAHKVYDEAHMALIFGTGVVGFECL